MGEYHTRLDPTGKVIQLCKLGTMDDWRYVRYEEAQRLAPLDAGANTNIRSFLNDERTLWRFPWPDEDEFSVAAIDQRQMFRTLLFACAELTCEHTQRCVSIHPEGVTSGYNVNVWITCPRQAAAGMKTSPVPPLFNLYGQRFRAGQPRTIFRCAWCGQPFSLTPEELIPVREAFQREIKRESPHPSAQSLQFSQTLLDRL